MNANELHKKTIEELEGDLAALVKDRFQFRMQKSTGQLVQTHLLKEVQKDIARVKTVLQAKQEANA